MLDNHKMECTSTGYNQ